MLEDLKTPNSIQPREYSKGGVTDGMSYGMAQPRQQSQCAVSELERRPVDLELQLARQRLQLQRSSRASSQLAYFHPLFL
ncbi:MAG: hypothetical protein A3J47_01510 [Candidatus Yanofskybacteria bacterium RIFCSPHIGHO2_02_FULL_43_22]|uniref:Uncharacterized protein n=1 Tax=Candidatus Yanofskybacteria bacterium RIFCSPHIGHO2_02_FULL_43_22 TaxID=1802681 RepID=A0A1F8FLB7_9BACT|nr:MAG: hypothetical protein A3J47_01510 [Candidatus Yanofskybacteria bacterium RIFCSPHIGHO2_02_FULL_43_22]